MPLLRAVLCAPRAANRSRAETSASVRPRVAAAVVCFEFSSARAPELSKRILTVAVKLTSSCCQIVPCAATAGVATGAPAATLSSQMALECKTNLFKFAPRDGKTRGFGVIPTESTRAEESPTSSNASTPSPSADKTDNRDFTFCEPSPDMRREDERLKTFAKWPIPFLRPQELAKSGFYYLGRGDEVRCAFCKVEIMRWEEGDDPAADHERWAPQCPLLRKYPTGNVPIGTAPLPDGRDECGLRAPPSPGPDAAPGTVRTPGPVNPRYASEAARLRSFKDWPRSLRQKPEDLADAGFFYTGQGDKTKCFYCDGGLKDWEDDDVPWEQHARWFDRCAYVQLVKGREYVQKVMSEHAALVPPANDGSSSPKESKNTPEPTKPEPAATESPACPEPQGSVIPDSKLCKICFAEELNICFVPCGHVVACAKCALTADKCPMCRRTFTSVVRLYYS